MDLLIEAQSVTRTFGGLTAVDHVDLQVCRGHTHAIIGPNGAGKSTLVNMLSGVLPVTSGEIRMDGAVVSGFPCYEVAALGLARTFQNVRLFENMTVLENVMVGCHSWSRQGILSAGLRLPGHWREERDIRQESLASLERVGLADEADAAAAALPFGKQRILEIARALAGRPKVLMLDEPASGLSTRETLQLARLLRDIVADGVTILLVDHDMQFVMDISDEVAVLDRGQKIAEGPPAVVQNDPTVIAAYLGAEDE